MMTTTNDDPLPKKEILFHGIPASPGIAIGEVFKVTKKSGLMPADTDSRITEDQVEKELERLNKALELSRQDIKLMQSRIQSADRKRITGVFDAHLLIVNDRSLHKDVTELIRREHYPADTAFTTAIQKYINVILSMNDAYFRGRADDIKDVATQIMNHLHGLADAALSKLPGPAIVLSRDLTPSDTASLDREHVLGFATETGSRTSHTAILARSLQLPAVVGMLNFVDRLSNGDRIIIDGYLGMVIANPTADTESLYREKMLQKEQLYAELRKENRMRAETVDGYCISLLANVEGVKDTVQVQENGAEGVGLYRTEYLFMNSGVLPSEEVQYQDYKAMAENLCGQPVVIRTLDVGGDKLDDSLISIRESNPFMGLRAIRLAQDDPEILATQIRAILRASAHGDVKLLFPMVSSLEELDFLLDMVEESKQVLRDRGQAFAEKIEIGIMIEIPSAAVAAPLFAEKVDFFSIGSNDLVQYSLAVDRTNEKVANLYKPASPAVLNLIKQTANAARENGIYTAVCGEIAGEPLFAPLLIGLGVRELSMSPGSLAAVRRMIRRMRFYDAEQLAEKALACRTAPEVRALAKEFLNTVAPDLAQL